MRGSDDPAEKFLAYLTEHRTWLMVQASLLTLAAIPLLPFALVFARRLQALEGEPAILGTAAAAGLLLGWAVAAPLTLMYGGLAWLADGTLAETEARNLTLLVNAGYGGVAALWAAAALFSGLALIGAQGVARWLGWFGIIVAIFCAVATFGWADSGLFSPGASFFVAYLTLAVYLLANAILMVRTK